MTTTEAGFAHPEGEPQAHEASYAQRAMDFLGKGFERVVEVVGVGPVHDRASDHYDNHDGVANPYKNGHKVKFQGREHLG